MGKLSLFHEFWLFIKQERRWWLLPIVAMLLLVGVLIVAVQSAGALSPFLYPSF